MRNLASYFIAICCLPIFLNSAEAVDIYKDNIDLSFAYSSNDKDGYPKHDDIAQIDSETNKDPVIASILSVALPGAGQCYNGEYKKGLIYAAISYAPILFINAKDNTSLLYLMSPLSWSLNITDAYYSAHRINNSPKAIQFDGNILNYPFPILISALSVYPGLGQIFNCQIGKALLFFGGTIAIFIATGNGLVDSSPDYDAQYYIATHYLCVLYALNIEDAFITAYNKYKIVKNNDASARGIRISPGITYKNNIMYYCLSINY